MYNSNIYINQSYSQYYTSNAGSQEHTTSLEFQIEECHTYEEIWIFL